MQRTKSRCDLSDCLHENRIQRDQERGAPLMDKPYLLHMLTSMPHVSPFDVNMAYDAGYDAVIPYVGVGLDDIAGLTQDTIFSRGPKGAKRTGIFIGGRECGLAADMLEAARTAMVPPFEVSLCADPSGAFTTAAAMVAKVERLLEQGGGGLQDMVVAVFGSGPVGSIAAVLCSLSGAQARLVSHSDMKRARDVVDNCNARYGTRIVPVAASTDDERAAAIADAAVVLACAKAGVQVLNAKQVAGAAQLVAV